MFVLEAPFFSNKEPGAASLDAPLCSSMVAMCLDGLYVRAAEAPVSSPGSLLPLAHFILLLLLPCGTRETTRAQIEPLWLGPAPFLQQR